MDGIEQWIATFKSLARRWRWGRGLAGLSLVFAAVAALVLTPTGSASPGERPRDLTGVLHRIGEAIERWQARWNLTPSRPNRPEADKPSSTVRSVALDPPLAPRPGPTKTLSPRVGVTGPVAAGPAPRAASISLRSVTLDPPLDEPNADSDLFPSASLVARVERLDRVDPPPSEASVAEGTIEAAPPTTPSPPETEPGSSVTAGIQPPHDGDRKKPERREGNGPEDKGHTTDRLGWTEYPDKIERLDKVERAVRPERIDRIDRVERVERVARPERVERAERREKVEKPERGRR